MRIIAGEAKGRRLAAPRSGTRPFTGRAKEAVFSSLHARVGGAAVLDLFAGSGSTMAAGNQMDRTTFLMEIDALYCDVILQRWENISGEAATSMELVMESLLIATRSDLFSSPLRRISARSSNNDLSIDPSSPASLFSTSIRRIIASGASG